MNRVFVDMDGVIADFEGMRDSFKMTSDQYKVQPGAYLLIEPLPGALEAVRSLIGAGYEVWIATKPPTGIPFAYADKVTWILNYLPELKRKIIITHDKGLLGDSGDFLVDDRPHKANCTQFKGTLIPFDSKGQNGVTWSEAIQQIKNQVHSPRKLSEPAQSE